MDLVQIQVFAQCLAQGRERGVPGKSRCRWDPRTILCVTRIISSPDDLRGWSGRVPGGVDAGRGASAPRQADLSSRTARPPAPCATFGRLCPFPRPPFRASLVCRSARREPRQSTGVGWDTTVHLCPGQLTAPRRASNVLIRVMGMTTATTPPPAVGGTRGGPEAGQCGGRRKDGSWEIGQEATALVQVDTES